MEEWLENPVQQQLWKERKSRRSSKENDIRLSILPYVSERISSSPSSTSLVSSTKSSFCCSSSPSPSSDPLHFWTTDMKEQHDSDTDDFDVLLQASTKLLAQQVSSNKAQSTKSKTNSKPDDIHYPVIIKPSSTSSNSRKCSSLAETDSDTVDCPIVIKPTTSAVTHPNNR